MSISVEWISVAKYTLSVLIMAGILYVVPQTTTLAATFGKALLGVTIYIVFLYAIDVEARKLVIQVLAEIKGVLQA